MDTTTTTTQEGSEDANEVQPLKKLTQDGEDGDDDDAKVVLPSTNSSERAQESSDDANEVQPLKKSTQDGGDGDGDGDDDDAEVDDAEVILPSTNSSERAQERGNDDNANDDGVLQLENEDPLPEDFVIDKPSRELTEEEEWHRVAVYQGALFAKKADSGVVMMKDRFLEIEDACLCLHNGQLMSNL